MAFWELMLLAVGLSMDAFAVAICKGLAMDKVTLQRAAVVGLWFGGFQGLMPLLGWLLGSRFAAYITAVDHWIAFALLVLLGINMIREARCPDEDDTNASLAFRVMLPMAVATSIDALAVGVTFAFLRVDIGPAVGFIGLTTLLLSAAGVWVGGRIWRPVEVRGRAVRRTGADPHGVQDPAGAPEHLGLKGRDHMDERRTLTVTQAGTLLPFLLEAVRDKSRNTVKGLLSRRQVLVDGRVVTRFDAPSPRASGWSCCPSPPPGRRSSPSPSSTRTPGSSPWTSPPGSSPWATRRSAAAPPTGRSPSM